MKTYNHDLRRSAGRTLAATDISIDLGLKLAEVCPSVLPTVRTEAIKQVIGVVMAEFERSGIMEARSSYGLQYGMRLTLIVDRYNQADSFSAVALVHMDAIELL